MQEVNDSLQINGDLKVYGAIVVPDAVNQALSLISSATSIYHVLTAYMKNPDSATSAGNFVSESVNASTVQISGKEINKGTLKITHTGRIDGADANAAALSIDLKVMGTACQGIFITSTTGGTTKGNIFNARFNGRDEFVIKGNGTVGVSLPIGMPPKAKLEIRGQDTMDLLRLVGPTGNTVRVSSDGKVTANMVELPKVVTPQSTTQPVLFSRGNGLKTELCVLFPNGITKVITNDIFK